MPDVRTYLDLSTQHVPERIGVDLSALSSCVAEYEYGAWLWVPPADSYPDVADCWDEEPDEVLAILRYARNLGCTHVRLDADANMVDDLPRWEW